MPIVYARHVQEVGGRGVAQIALSAPRKLYTARGPEWLARFTGADQESQRLEHESYSEARRILEQVTGEVHDYIFSRIISAAGHMEKKRWSVTTSPLNRENYMDLLQRLRRVKGLDFVDPNPLVEYYVSQLDSMILQLIQLNRNGLPQQASR